MRRILVVSNIPTPYNDALFKETASRPDVALHVVYCAEREANRLWTLPADKGYSYTIMKGWSPPRVGHINPGVVKFILSYRPDIVVVTGSYLSPTMQLAIAALRMRGMPWVYWGEELQHHAMGALRNLARSIFRRPLLKARGVLAIGRRAIESYRRAGVSADRIVNFHYYADSRRFRAAGEDRASARSRVCREHAIDPVSTIFVYAGQLIYRKGVDTLIDALGMILREGKRAVVLIAGGGPLETELRTAARAAGAESSVRFLGFVEPDALPELFAGSDCFVLPSRSEGWGMVISEAMAAGTPVISSDAVNAGIELIEDRKSGFLFRPGDAPDLARAMREMAAARAQPEALTSRVLTAIESEAVDRAATRLLAILEAALRDKGAGLSRSVA